MNRMANLAFRILSIIALGSAPGIAAPANAGDTAIQIGSHEIHISSDLGDFDMQVSRTERAPGLTDLRLTLTSAFAATPPPISLSWALPSHDIAGAWTPDFAADRTIAPDWREIGKLLHSMLTRQAPVLTLFGHDDNNRLTFALSDAINPSTLDARVREEDALIYSSVDLFTERHEKVETYSVDIRFDERPQPFYTTLKEIAEWWAAMPGYQPALVPEVARQPMYSTWYSYHQNISADSMLRELRASSAIGLRAIIVDDGWQTLDSSRGYGFAGDWKPERLRDMKAFVDAVHEQGMKAILWYSVPFIGENSQAFKQFQGKFLEHIEHYGSYVLDPRYPEVRAFLIGHYRHAVAEWGWDGLKLDFIDRFQTQPDTILEIGNGRDYASVYAAVDRLMTDVITELTALNPEVVIEFRQHYIGPKMRTYGNMFRAHDSPNLALVNRKKIVDLRLLSGSTAVHSDMLMWHYDEAAEIAAFQLLNALFSVPQVSVRLADLPQSQLDMLRFYLDYWTRNRAVLLDGEFSARDPMMNFPRISGSNEDKRIVALYADLVVDLDAADRRRRHIDIVNVKTSKRVVLNALENLGSYEVAVFDCRGLEQFKENVDISAGVTFFEVPVSGLLTLRRLAD